MPKRGEDKKKSPEKFKEEVNLKYKGQFIVTGTYTLSRNRVEVMCRTCGTKFSRIANKFTTKDSYVLCPKCKLKRPQYAQDVYKETKGKITVLDEYQGHKTPIRYRCNKHHYIFKRSPKSFKQATYKCRKCKYEHATKKQRKTNVQFKDELSKVHGGTIIGLESYVNTHTPIKFKCTKCGTVFKTEPNAILRISGCPACAESKGELAIANILDKLGVSYIIQKRFDKCRYIRPLPFDFYINDYGTLIEFDGPQHNIPVDFWGGEDGLRLYKKRDSIKNKFALDNGYKLIRIPYTQNDEKISNIIENFINKGSSPYLVTTK